MSKESERFHDLAKDAGNKLRAYILSVSSGATGIFFLALTSSSNSSYTMLEKWLLVIGLLSFVATVAICLYELRVDAQRFFFVAKELEKQDRERTWNQNECYKKLRYWLLHASYVTLSIGVIATAMFLTIKVMGT
jgi:hypothetical protein